MSCPRPLPAAALLLLCLLLGMPAGDPARGQAREQPSSPASRMSGLLTAAPDEEAPCPTTPYGPLRLPPMPPEPALGIVFADGRAARWDSLRSVGEQHYWSMEEACAALNAALVWDPRRLAGEIRIDSLRCRFLIGGEILHCAGRAIQLGAAVLYLDNHLLLPLSFAERVPAILQPDRFQFLPDSRVLAQRALGPPTGEVRIQEVRGRTYVRWTLPESPTARLHVDGGGHLVVDLPGVFVDPLAPPAPESRPGACLREIWPYAGGTRFVFRVDPSVVAWRAEWRVDRGEYRIVLSRLRDDLNRWRHYQPWPGSGAGHAASLEPQRDRGIILVLPSEAGGRGATAEAIRHANEFIRELGERTASFLEVLGERVSVVRDPGESSRAGWVSTANSRGGAACIYLQPHFVGERVAAGHRVVSVPSVPGGRPLQPLAGVDADGAEYDQAQADELRRIVERADRLGFRSWDDASALHSAASDRLSWTVALHLQAAAADLPVRRQQWPSAALRGLDMPGVILYVGGRGGRERFPAEEDRQALERVAEALALGIEAFAAGARESGGNEGSSGAESYRGSGR